MMADNANNDHKSLSEEYDSNSPVSKRAGKLLLHRPLFGEFPMAVNLIFPACIPLESQSIGSWVALE